MPFLIHPDLPPEQYIDVPESAVPMHRTAGWRSASDEEVAEFREETRLVRVVPETTTELVTESADTEEGGGDDDDDASTSAGPTHRGRR